MPSSGLIWSKATQAVAIMARAAGGAGAWARFDQRIRPLAASTRMADSAASSTASAVPAAGPAAAKRMTAAHKIKRHKGMGPRLPRRLIGAPQATKAAAGAAMREAGI